MPAKSARQQRMMGADLARARKGKKTKTGLGAAKLSEMASAPKGGYPAKKAKDRQPSMRRRAR